MTDSTAQITQAPVSVIIPVYNGERYIGEALESIFSQTCKPAEVIVVDDGSTDRTVDLVKACGHPVCLLQQLNSGVAVARNTGVQAACCEFLAWLDHDDLWVENKLELQLAAFRGDPDLDMVFGHCSQFYCESLDETERSKLTLPDKPLPAYLSGSRLIKRETFLSIGLYDPTLRLGDCLEWHARAMDAGLKIKMLSEVVFLRRIHATNMGRTQVASRNQYAQAMKKLLDRRRQQKRV